MCCRVRLAHTELSSFLSLSPLCVAITKYPRMPALPGKEIYLSLWYWEKDVQGWTARVGKRRDHNQTGACAGAQAQGAAWLGTKTLSWLLLQFPETQLTPGTQCRSRFLKVGHSSKEKRFVLAVSSQVSVHVWLSGSVGKPVGGRAWGKKGCSHHGRQEAESENRSWKHEDTLPGHTP